MEKIIATANQKLANLVLEKLQRCFYWVEFSEENNCVYARVGNSNLHGKIQGYAQAIIDFEFESENRILPQVDICACENTDAERVAAILQATFESNEKGNNIEFYAVKVEGQCATIYAKNLPDKEFLSAVEMAEGIIQTFAFVADEQREKPNTERLIEQYFSVNNALDGLAYVGSCVVAEGMLANAQNIINAIKVVGKKNASLAAELTQELVNELLNAATYLSE